MSKSEKALTDGFSGEMFKLVRLDEREAERIGEMNYSYWRSTFGVFLKNKTAVAILIFLGIVLLFTIIQPWLPNQKDANLVNIDPKTGSQYLNRKPDGEFWFGTNSIGQDLWARVWSGTRTSLFIGVTIALVQAVVGLIVGALWGYVRKLDPFMTELYNVVDNIPTTVLLMLLTYIMRPSLQTMIIAMSITGWLGMARFIRNQIVIIRDREYNLASRCLGTPTYRIVTKNLLPYLVSVLMLRMALAIPATIGNEVFLAYIGLGLPIKMPSLGNLVNEGRALMQAASTRYQLIFPAIVLSAITISFYVLGNAFADAADPRNHV